MVKVVACIIARTVSSRLPLKVLRRIDTQGHCMIDFLIARLKLTRAIDEIFICTSDEAVDEILEDIAERNNIQIYRGSPDKVINRLLAVGQLTKADILLRITGDNPFTSYEYIDQQIDFMLTNNLEYVRLIDSPLGATAEAIRYDALIRCNEKMDPSVSEYLMLYIFEPRDFNCGVIKPFPEDYSHYSVTVDWPVDLTRSRKLIELYGENSIPIKLSNILTIYKQHELPAMVIKPSGKIKLPYEKEISFEQFKVDMERRTQSSLMLKLYE
jgi:spore coat polysaccharide biosynthesis protein SpsF